MWLVPSSRPPVEDILGELGRVQSYAFSDLSSRVRVNPTTRVNRSFPYEEILAAIKTAYPAYNMPPRFEGPANTPTQFDHTRKESLGIPLRPLEETVADVVDFLQTRSAL